MSHPLGPVARALVQAARDGLGPDAAAAARVRARVASAVGGGTGSATAAGAARLAAAIGVAGLVAGGGLVVRGHHAAEPTTPIAATSSGETIELVAPSFRIVVSESRTSGPSRPASRTLDTGGPESGRPEFGRPAAGQPSDVPDAPDAPDRPTLAREVELIDQAMAALRGDELTTALAAIQRYELETGGDGQLAEDGAAIEIEAMCRLHVDTVAPRLAEFDRRWPSSAQRPRLTAACAVH